MKKKTIALALVLVMAFGVTMGGTFAYLTSTDEVVNTFTVGNVKITLDETDVDEYGVEIENTDPVKGNEYKLIPGHTYMKDPTVHFGAKSEASYLFVKVVNGISAIEADTVEGGYQDIDAQIKAKGWTALTNVDGVYYKEVPANTTDSAIDYPVFDSFKLADDANIADEQADYANAKITITAYAVQADGMEDAADAWTKAGF